jgi:uncharacterized OsmC-like protein
MNAISEPKAAKPVPAPRNGVDTPTLFATIDVVADDPELAKFQFRANGTWLNGTHSRVTFADFNGAGADHKHVAEYSTDADHPTVLTGADRGPTPVEYLLAALSSCITAGIANVAAARGVTLEEVESSVEGDIDLRGILGLSDQVRNGYQGIRINFRIRGDAPPEKLREVVEQSRARSAVFDVLTNGVQVTVNVDAGD